MFSLPFRRSPRTAGTIDALYGTIVAQARSPAFYRGYGVPDTVDARLDMIVLHLVLVLRRLRVGQSPGPLGQALFDRFCQDMDDNFREMGVGDLAVPKRMRRVAEGFYGRAKVYEAALASDHAAELAAAVARNVFGQTDPALGARCLYAGGGTPPRRAGGRRAGPCRTRFSRSRGGGRARPAARPTAMNKPRLAEQPWKVPVAVTDVPETGKRVDLAADAATRGAIAKLASVVGVPRLEAQFDLTRQGDDGLHVVGRVAATVEQNCVVTLEPMQTEIDEAVDMVFTPTHAPPARAERVKTLEDGDPPEALKDGAVDLGALAIEFLLLGIDPYPRKPGAVFDAPRADDPGPHPFAALAALKKGMGGKDA